MIDNSSVRSHFPALDPASHGGTAPVYFDSPAGTQIASEALAEINDYLVRRNANHDGAFRASRESDAMVADTRAALADFLGASRPEEICFGQNMTSLTLHISRSIARELSPGDEVVVTRLDHDANISPWLLAARDRDCTVRWVDFDPADCTWSKEELSRQVTPRTRLVAVGYASNSTGTVNPVAETARIAHEAGALCFVDAVHYAPHGPIDVSALGCDLLACSAYKFFGPHTGILWGRYDLLERLAAYKVRPAADAPPHKWETGTQSFESIAGVRGALSYLEWVGRAFGGTSGGTFGAGAPATRRAALRAGMEGIQESESGLCAALREGLTSVKGLCIRGIVDASRMKSRVPTFSFTMQGRHPRKICQALDAAGISAWDGNYYAPEVTRRLGLEGSGGMVRVGAVHYNTLAEVQRLVDALDAISRDKA
ncbi:MAG: cysteine desulfurase-like protein [Spirochaetia bacterium]